MKEPEKLSNCKQIAGPIKTHQCKIQKGEEEMKSNDEKRENKIIKFEGLKCRVILIIIL